MIFFMQKKIYCKNCLDFLCLRFLSADKGRELAGGAVQSVKSLGAKNVRTNMQKVRPPFGSAILSRPKRSAWQKMIKGSLREGGFPSYLCIPPDIF
ncbi:MAG: hypothetical protein J6C15_07815 [Bacteroidaceae bacterium]|nr:hypothetical protein [Bacteroidaceae bacterium]